MIKQECIGIPDILLLVKDLSRNYSVPRSGYFHNKPPFELGLTQP